MKLEKAIEIKLQWRKDNYPPALPDEMNADMLSINALKQVIESRFDPSTWEPKLLPGETEERILQREGKDIIGNYSYEERQK